MNRNESLGALLCGFLFAVGLGISGMTQPQKVVGFLDVFGNWDPSLILVMAGAVLVYSLGFRLVIKKPKPLFTTGFLVPSNRQIDSSLILGSALFGMGWGLGGFCPGPALTSIASWQTASIIFVLSMLATMWIFEKNQERRGNS